MFERFMEDAIKVIMLAQEESRRLGHNYVGTEQILLGIIAENKGVGARSLKECGVSLGEARKMVEREIGKARDKISIEIPFTSRAKRVLESAWNFARSVNSNFISTEHLLAGVLAQEDCRAVKVLLHMGVTVEKVQEALEKKMGVAAGMTKWALPAGQPDEGGTAAVQQVSTIVACALCHENIHPSAKLCRHCQRPQGDHAKRCPMCAEVIWKDAINCRYCKAIIQM